MMERLIQERKVNVAAFGVHLTRHQPRQSEVCIGCYDPSKYNGAITWNVVTSQSYWSIALDNIKVNGVNASPRIVTAVRPVSLRVGGGGLLTACLFSGTGDRYRHLFDLPPTRPSRFGIPANPRR